jgi:FkbM family methyltransferase
MQPSEIYGLPEVTREHRGRPYRIPDDPIVVGVFQGEEAGLRGPHWLTGPGDVVVDVGSHFGAYALPALACGATVYAVDPDPDAMPILEAICALNPDLPGRLVTLPVALADVGGLTPFYRAALEKLPHPSMVTPLDCEFSSLDQLAVEQNLDRLDWVKIDVEGLELAVLRGGERTLAEFGPTVLVEDHEGLYPYVREMGSKQLCIDFLEGLGYHVDASLREGAYLLASR